MIEFRVNNRTYTGYVSLSLRRSIYNPSGALNVVFSARQLKLNGQRVQIPIKAGDYVQVLVNEIPKLTGFVDELNINYAADDHTLNIIARDTTADLIDSSVPDGAKTFNNSVTILQMCQTIIGALNLKMSVINEAGTLKVISNQVDNITASNGQKALDFITKYARKAQVYLVPTGDGNLSIFKPTGVSNGSILLNENNNDQNNIKTCTAKISMAKRYNKYVCRSQNNFSANILESTTVEKNNINNFVIDSKIRNSRYLEIQAEQSMDLAETTTRVNEEANLRRVNSEEYSVTMQGYQNEFSNIVYDFGQTVKVSDDYVGKKGAFTIIEVEYSDSIEEGSETKLVLSSPDAFKGTPVMTPKEEKRSFDNYKINVSAREKLGLRGDDSGTFNDLTALEKFGFR